MAGISVSGMGSGLDVSGIVKQLMSVEQQPLLDVQSRKKDYNTQLSAYGQLKSAISSLQSAMGKLGSVDKFEVYSATSSNTDAFTATASSAASKGTFDLRVVNLAEAHKLRTSAVSSAQNSFGTGNLLISVGSNSFNVSIDSSHNTLEGIRTAINSAADNSGVTASIVSDGTNKYLTLTSNKTGAANAITVTATDDGSGASSLTALENANMSTLQAAQDAKIYIDGDPPSLGGNGIEVTSASNTVTGAIEGVTLTLKKTTASFETLDVSRDTTTVEKSVQDFVSAYNTVRSKLTELGKGQLSGDNTVLSIESQLRGVLNTPPSGLTGSYNFLSQVGIKTERDGTLSVNTTELESALSNDFGGVAQLFANDDQGYAFRMEALAKTMVNYGGVVASKEDGINSTIRSLTKQEDQWKYRLEQIQQRYTKEFTALDSTLSQMQSTSNYLSQQLAKLG